MNTIFSKLHLKTIVCIVVNLVDFFFRYKLENGEIYRGKTYILNNPRVNLYLMFGANETIYWVRFSSHEYVYKKSLNKTVRIGNYK